MRLPATTRAERGCVCWRRTFCSRFVHLDTTLLPDRTGNGVFSPKIWTSTGEESLSALHRRIVVTPQFQQGQLKSSSLRRMS